MVERGAELRFTVEARHELGIVQQVLVYYLERYRALQAFLDGLIHGGHASAADLFQDLVTVAKGVGYEVDAGEGGVGGGRGWVRAGVDAGSRSGVTAGCGAVA